MQNRGYKTNFLHHPEWEWVIDTLEDDVLISPNIDIDEEVS